MSFAYETKIALRKLSILEDGMHAIADIKPLYEEADPALVYFIFAWLRSRYHAGHPASDGVLGRMVELCQASPKVAKLAKQGEKDSLVEWFEEAYSYRDLDREAFITLIVEKLEG